MYMHILMLMLDMNMSTHMKTNIHTDTDMAADQKHWVCNRLGRPFRDMGL